ncbi:MAG: hypothetical protein H0U25_00560 [Thermoleophilaceae bacterium]|nr:hypothetical protein [Thermoleophilaceae bacterium]
MCAQCMATAATAATAATGMRAWLAARAGAWLTPARLRRASAVLIVIAVAATATLSGSA